MNIPILDEYAIKFENWKSICYEPSIDHIHRIYFTTDIDSLTDEMVIIADYYQYMQTGFFCKYKLNKITKPIQINCVSLIIIINSNIGVTQEHV